MKKYKVTWYDQTEVKQVDSLPIEASDMEEATKLAFMRYNGKPPAPLLMLEEIE